MNVEIRTALESAGLDPVAVSRIVEVALAEDVGTGDVTTLATIPEEQDGVAEVVARADGVVAGLAVAALVFDLTHGAAAAGRSPRFVNQKRDGDRVARGDVLATVAGPVRTLLTAERTALNLLCRMSGV